VIDVIARGALAYDPEHRFSISRSIGIADFAWWRPSACGRLPRVPMYRCARYRRGSFALLRDHLIDARQQAAASFPDQHSIPERISCGLGGVAVPVDQSKSTCPAVW